MSKDSRQFKELRKKIEEVSDTTEGMEEALHHTADTFVAFGEAAQHGMLLLRDITQEEWDKAVEARERQAKNDFYYGGLLVLSSEFKDVGVQIISRVVDGFVQPFDGMYYRLILAYKSPWCYQLTLGAVLVILVLLIAFMVS